MNTAIGDQANWKSLTLQEIASVKPRFQQRYSWELNTVENENEVILYVRFHHSKHPEKVKVLRLTYGTDFPKLRPRESFVDPNNLQNEGSEFWIDDGKQAFKSDHNPPVICLEGTWGFHQVLHKDRDPMRASLNKLLLEIQQCYDNTTL